MGRGKVAVHFLEPNEAGPIKSIGLVKSVNVDGENNHGTERRFSVACDPEAGLPNYANSGVSYTGEPGPVTCPKCMETEHYTKQMKIREETRSNTKLPRARKEDFPEGVLQSDIQESDSEEDGLQSDIQKTGTELPEQPPEQPDPAEASTDVATPEPVPVEESPEPEEV